MGPREFPPDAEGAAHAARPVSLPTMPANGSSAAALAAGVAGPSLLSRIPNSRGKGPLLDANSKAADHDFRRRDLLFRIYIKFY